MFDTVDAVRQAGFHGFTRVNDLIANRSSIPSARGIYLALYTGSAVPVFLAAGTAGCFARGNPNVPVARLQARWISGTPVIYIGQAGGTRGAKPSRHTLHSRISQYLDFGLGKDVRHWGGRLIWQIGQSMDLLLCWRPLMVHEQDPRSMETALIRAFEASFGTLPFANLQH